MSTHDAARTSEGHQENRRLLCIALGISTVFFVAEFVGGWFTNSLALMADAGHMLTDVAALALGLFALIIACRPATPEKTYGYFRAEILAALVNGVTLVLISVFIFYEAYQRLMDPPVVKSGPMLAVASAGLAANLASAHFLSRAHHESLNVRGAFLHVMSDALGSVGAMIAGLLMLFWKLYVADAVISIFTTFLILYSAWRLVRDAVDILLEGTPSHINLGVLQRELSSVASVESIHDLHVWTLTSGIHAMSCHAVVRSDEDKNAVLEKLCAIMLEKFDIEHTTIQIEEASLQHDVCSIAK